MRLYVAWIPETREAFRPVSLATATEPGDSYIPIAVVRAETRGRARSEALRAMMGEPGSDVCREDWNQIRMRLVRKHDSGDPGVVRDELVPEAWEVLQRVPFFAERS